MASVASCNHAGDIVVFDSTGTFQGSKILRADSSEGKANLKMVETAKGTGMRRVNNTYFARIWMDGDDANDTGFPGQGK